MKEFNLKGYIVPDVQKFYLERPDSLGWADRNLQLRLEFAAAAGIKGETKFGLLSRPRKKVEADFMKLLGYDPKKKIILPPVDGELKSQKKRMENYKRVVQLIKEGLITEYHLAA